jgi:hypothetical protein
VYLAPVDIVRDVLDTFTEADRATIRKNTQENSGLFTLNPTIGRHVRNKYKLWDENNPHTTIKGAQERAGIIVDPKHPDNLSGCILEAVWLCIVAGVSPELATERLIE